MIRSKLLKVRVLPSTAEQVRQGARENGSTMSTVIRDLLTEYAHGRSASPVVRADMLVVRQLGNLVIACAEATTASNPDAGRKLIEIGTRLRALAARHLGPSS